MAILEFELLPRRKETSMAMPTPPSSHTLSDQSMMVVEENIQKAESIITMMKLDRNFKSSLPLFQENRKEEAKEFVKCVKNLRTAMHFLVSEHSSGGGSSTSSKKLVLAQNLMQIAMRRLENEFQQILSANKENLNDRLPMPAMSDLQIIADCMVLSGYGRECMKIYRVIRVSMVEEGLYRLGIERYSSSQINKMSPEALNHQIKTWLKAVNFAVKSLFHSERFLCDHVFAVSDTIRESCFTEISKDGGAINLFRFPELVAKGKRWPEKAFLLMELYETIKDLQPQIESIFSFEAVSYVNLQVLSSLNKLGESVQNILTEFEVSIQKNPSRVGVPGGGIHPLTNSVMNYVSILANYTGVLSDIIIAADDSATPTQMPFPESYFESPHPHERQTSAVSVRLAWIMLVLLCKLDRKAKIYNDIALSYLFLANNLQFVLEKVRTTAALKFLLGDDWLAKLDRKVKLYAANYESMAWNKVYQCLPEISTDMVKAHFRQFITAFKEACKKQKSWVVPDAMLRNEIKVSIIRKLVPAYREFYDNHFTTLSEERNLEALVRLSPDDLETYLSDEISFQTNLSLS